MFTTPLLGPAADTAIMMPIAAPVQAAAVQPGARVSGPGDGRTRAVGGDAGVFTNETKARSPAGKGMGVGNAMPCLESLPSLYRRARGSEP
jgi:hypothetical protein